MSAPNTVNSPTGLTWLLGLAALMVILAGLKAAEAIVIPLLLALFIGIICTPLLHFLTRRRVPVVLAVVIIMAQLVVFGILFGLFVGSAIDSFVERLPEYQRRLESELVQLLPWLEAIGVPVSSQQLLDHFNPSVLMDWVGKALSNLGSLITNLFLVLFIVIFLLLEEATFGEKLRQALPSAHRSFAQASSFVQQVNRYLVIKSIVSLITGLLITLWLWILGVDFPLLWGVVALLMNFIPNVGSIIAAIPAVLLALVQLGFYEAALAASGYVAVNIVLGSLIEPRFMGRGLGLSPLVVFLSLVIWGWLFGVVGMLLSIPLTMIVKIALEQTPSTQWVAVLLGNGLQPSREEKEE